ncbi:MAG TPA: alpha/beta fold hydrolase [Gemmatales bacterium]|nr:alpha/beta fold hydrolase [Gemmatales bacterium]
MLQLVVALLLFPPFVVEQNAQSALTPQTGEYIAHDFRFESGESLKELKLFYRTFGRPQRDEKGIVRNAVLVTHGTTGSSSSLMRDEFVKELFGKGQPLDAEKFYIIMPDGIGHGQSSKPSDGLHSKFPHYGYRDMVKAQYLLITEGLKINHLRLVMGTSMGGMHTWLWGQMYPEFMDALMPLASLPSQISGRNRVWRRLIIDAIRHDPDWKNGDYIQQPQSLRTVAQMMYLMSSNPLVRQQEAPSRAKADEQIEQYAARFVQSMDANDVLYAVESSSDYDPAPGLEKIRAPLLAINFADDLINPPELGILEREIKRVRGGKAITMPLSDKTRGHGTHTLAAVWKEHLVEFLKETAR